MSPGQVSVQTVDAPATVAEVSAVLSAARASFVLLEIFATLVRTVPFAVPAFTWKVNEKIAIALAGKVVIVQVIVPFPAGVGSVKLGPEVCAADTKVVLAGIESVSVTV
jgi:hypothetical protein